VRVRRRVVDQDIDPAECRQGILDEGFYCPFVSDVSGDGQRRST